MSKAAEQFAETEGSRLASKTTNVIMAFVFASAMTWTYANALTSTWSYLGFTYFKPDTGLFVIAMTAAVFPSLLLPLRAKRAGDFILWIIYFGLYVPSVVLPVLMGKLTYSENLALVGSLLAAFVIICIPPPQKAHTTESPLVAMNASLFWTCFFLIYLVLNLWVIIAFGGRLRVVGLQDIYVQRFAADVVLGGSLVGYATGILAGAFNPFLMAVGLTEKRYLIAALGATGQVLIFATAALKAVMVSIVLIPAFYFFVFRKKPFELSKVGAGFVVPAVGLSFVAVNIYLGPQSLFQFIFTLVYMRTFCIVGVITGVYAEFFRTHPYTYFSHIGPMRLFVGYPYSDVLGNMIGSFLVPFAPFDANANFFATDGMAALGFWGIVLSGLLFRLFIALFDACAREQTLPLLCCAIIPALVGVMNSSMFETLLTGGAAMLAVLVYLYSNATPTVLATS